MEAQEDESSYTWMTIWGTAWGHPDTSLSLGRQSEQGSLPPDRSRECKGLGCKRKKRTMKVARKIWVTKNPQLTDNRFS